MASVVSFEADMAISYLRGSYHACWVRQGHNRHEFGLAVDRVRAAAEAVRHLPHPFVLTARAENFLHGRPDLADTIRRLQAFAEAGADVVYAPGLKSREDIATVGRSVERPVNVVMGLRGVSLSVVELAKIGVRRVSIGSALSRVALAGFLRAAREMKEHGSFTFADDAVPFDELNATFGSFSS
jgi:2-methylisocitrate lyase-like PEP mutase family enzyme